MIFQKTPVLRVQFAGTAHLVVARDDITAVARLAKELAELTDPTASRDVLESMLRHRLSCSMLCYLDYVDPVVSPEGSKLRRVYTVWLQVGQKDDTDRVMKMHIAADAPDRAAHCAMTAAAWQLSVAHNDFPQQQAALVERLTKLTVEGPDWVACVPVSAEPIALRDPSTDTLQDS